MKDRMIPMLLILASGAALIVNAQGKLFDPNGNGVANILFDLKGYKAPGGVQSIGTFAVAFFAYLLVISVMDDKQAEWLTLILVLGALYYNESHSNGQGVLSTFFSPVGSSSSPGEIQIPDPGITPSSTDPVILHPFG